MVGLTGGQISKWVEVTMNKEDIINLVSERTDHTKKDTTDMLETIFDAITDGMKSGNPVVKHTFRDRP